MKINIEVNNKSKSPIKKSIIQKTVFFTLENCGVDFLSTKNISISFAFVSPEEIKELNRIYRKKNKATDVLSFAEFKSQKDLKKSKDEDLFLGEIILCYNDIEKYVSHNKKEISLERELAKVISHGVLHLLGLRHGKKMFEIQEGTAKKIFP